MSEKDKYQVVKTDEGDWAIVYNNTPVAMSILSEDIAWEMARHLNNRKARSVIFRSNFPDADLVITGGKGFHIRFANGRGASVQWGTGNYCDRQSNLRGRDFFDIQVKDEKLRRVYTEFEGPTFVNYEQMFADWGSNNAEISPGFSGTEEGWVNPDKIVDILYHLSKMPALEGGKDPVDADKIVSKMTKGMVDNIIFKMIEGTEDQDLLDGVSVWKQTNKDRRPRIHEWRNYLPKEILEVWGHFTPRERALCFMLCREQASNEEWD